MVDRWLLHFCCLLHTQTRVCAARAEWVRPVPRQLLSPHPPPPLVNNTCISTSAVPPKLAGYWVHTYLPRSSWERRTASSPSPHFQNGHKRRKKQKGGGDKIGTDLLRNCGKHISSARASVGGASHGVGIQAETMPPPPSSAKKRELCSARSLANGKRGTQLTNVKQQSKECPSTPPTTNPRTKPDTRALRTEVLSRRAAPRAHCTALAWSTPGPSCSRSSGRCRRRRSPRARPPSRPPAPLSPLG